MIIRKAIHLGMCFGVRDAIVLAQKHACQNPLTVLGELVHNPGVLASLKSSGIKMQKHYAEVSTPSVMISAHGVSERMRKRLQQSSLKVHDATCPLVHHAHRQLAGLVAQGFFPIVIGVLGHTEVCGLVEDYDDYRVILNTKDIRHIPFHPQLGIVAQTTQPILRVKNLVQEIRNAFPKSQVVFCDTVCQPTKNRQNAAANLADESDIMIVIGGANSNNTRELVKTCLQFCERVQHVRDERDLRKTWFVETDRVGITAGTSTPEDSIQSVITKLDQWAREVSDKTELIAQSSIKSKSHSNLKWEL